MNHPDVAKFCDQLVNRFVDIPASWWDDPKASSKSNHNETYMGQITAINGKNGKFAVTVLFAPEQNSDATTSSFAVHSV